MMKSKRERIKKMKKRNAQWYDMIIMCRILKKQRKKERKKEKQEKEKEKGKNIRVMRGSNCADKIEEEFLKHGVVKEHISMQEVTDIDGFGQSHHIGIANECKNFSGNPWWHAVPIGNGTQRTSEEPQN